MTRIIFRRTSVLPYPWVFKREVPHVWKGRQYRSLSGNNRQKIATVTYNPDTHDFFHYSSGKWIYNDALRHAERYRRFDIDALKQAAASAVSQTIDEVESFQKIAEGGLNRVFRITFRDSSHIIARIPYHILLPEKAAIASEVATMDYLRSHDIPVPQVYAYSTNKLNPVGTEYILMEEMPGREIGDRWYSMSEKERTDLTIQIVKLEAKLFSIPFPASGSIYYPEDLDHRVDRVDLIDPRGIKKFCVGPSTALSLWYGERSKLEITRGPFKDALETYVAGANKERAFLEEFAAARYPFGRMRREVFDFRKQEPASQLDNLDKFLQIAASTVPYDRKDLLQPVLRHPDLQPNNIFVSESFQVTGLIDWQHSSILPLFLAAGIPRYFQNFDDKDSAYLNKPVLPDEFHILDQSQQDIEMESFRRRQLHYYYVAASATYNKAHYKALEDDFSILRSKLYHLATDPWEGDNVSLKAVLIEVCQRWNDVCTSESSKPFCPISFSDEEVLETQRLSLELAKMDAGMSHMEEILSVSAEGWIPSDHYEQAKGLEREIRRIALEDAESDSVRSQILQHWPFDDHNEDE